MIIGRGPTRPKYPRLLIHPLGPVFRHLPLALRRHLLYLKTHGRWGNFSSPKRFTEKIQWRILNDRRDLISLACDKLRSKHFVEERWHAAGMSAKFKTPATLWSGSNLDELYQHMHGFPPRFVMKPNHTSGRYLIADTATCAVSNATVRELFNTWIRNDEETDILGHSGYLGAERMIFVEERIGTGDDVPIDIRIFTNRGEISGIACTGTKPDGMKWSATYDADFVRRPSGYAGQLPLDAITPLSDLHKADERELRSAVRVVSEMFDQVRVDIYRHGSLFYFGEFTVYSSGGLVKYNDETDFRLGALWQLPDATSEDRSARR